MKYIRTKEGKIFDLTSKEYVVNGDDLILHKQYETITGPDIEPGEMYVPAIAIVRKHNEYHYVGIIEKQADTIEELCDEFVVIDEDNEPNIKQGRDIHHCRRIWAINNCLIYGAVWTDEGLIYVAKMNDEGELELL